MDLLNAAEQLEVLAAMGAAAGKSQQEAIDLAAELPLGILEEEERKAASAAEKADQADRRLAEVRDEAAKTLLDLGQLAKGVEGDCPSPAGIPVGALAQLQEQALKAEAACAVLRATLQTARQSTCQVAPIVAQPEAGTASV